MAPYTKFIYFFKKMLKNIKVKFISDRYNKYEYIYLYS